MVRIFTQATKLSGHIWRPAYPYEIVVIYDPAPYHEDFAGIYSHAMREFVILPEY